MRGKYHVFGGKVRPLLCGVLAVSMVAGMFALPNGNAEAKGKKASLATKKLSIQVGKKKKISIKNKKKKAVYRFKASSSRITVSKKGVVTAKKAGSAKVTVRETYKKKTRKLGTVKIQVTKKAEVTKQPVTTPGTDATPVPTQASDITPAPDATQAPAPTPDATQTPEPEKPTPTPEPVEGIVYQNFFEDGNVKGFGNRGSSIEISNSCSHSENGMNSLYVTGRSANWHGTGMDITGLVIEGTTYQFSAWVKQDSGNTEKIAMTLSYNDESGNPQYKSLVDGTSDGLECPSGEWVHLSGSYEMPVNATALTMYFESPTSTTIDFYVDDVEITGLKAVVEKEFEVTEEIHQAMVSKSLFSTGNNAKIKQVLEKARAGGDVTLAYIGGSITEGGGYWDNSKCYAQVSASAFAKAYGKGDGSNVHFVNAGMSGTPSSLGVVRYQRDVLNRQESGGARPDILFIEFSVNDYGEVTACGGYEGLIRQALKSGTAVVLIFSVFKNNNVVCESAHRPYGEYYSLPMISMGNATKDYYKKDGFNAWYFNDDLHPNADGYQLMSDCIMNLFAEIDKEEKEADIDISKLAPKKTDAFEGIRYVDAAVDVTKEDAVESVEAGGFTGKDSATGNFQYTYNGKVKAAWFPDSWMHTAKSGDGAWKMKVNCRTFMLTYKMSSVSSFGKADLYVDGVKKTTMNSYDKSGWNNGTVYVAIQEEKEAVHTVEIRMADGDEAKNFTILAVGYR